VSLYSGYPFTGLILLLLLLLLLIETKRRLRARVRSRARFTYRHFIKPSVNRCPCPLQRRRARAVFSETAGRLFEPAAGGRVPDRAEKTVCAREVTPEAWPSCRAMFLLGTFLCAKEKYIKTNWAYLYDQTHNTKLFKTDETTISTAYISRPI